MFGIVNVKTQMPCVKSANLGDYCKEENKFSAGELWGWGIRFHCGFLGIRKSSAALREQFL